MALREEFRKALGDHEVLPDDWTARPKVIKDAESKVFGLSSGKRKNG